MSSSSSEDDDEPSISHWVACSPLGSGSFGHVSLALNLDDGSLFAAISCLFSLLALQNELHILRPLRSPFVVRFLGVDCSADHRSVPRHLFLEYMDGGSLAGVLKKCGGKLSEECQVRHYTRSVLQGLHYLHQNGIVHCDIKSHNILIGSSGVKIADFGAALRAGEASRRVRGTPLWMAPEVAQGHEPTPSSDMWSLGCTVVEMMQGRPPWGHVNSIAAALLKVGCSQENPPLPQSISAEAKDFLLRCLQRDPKARWTAAQLLEHPYLCDSEAGECCRNQPSPRSMLEFLPSDGESDWETEDVMGSSVPKIQCMQGLNTAKKQSSRAGKGASEAGTSCGKWLTVKRAERWCEERAQLAPFFSRQQGAAELVSHGGKVSFSSAGFLKNRPWQVRKLVG